MAASSIRMLRIGSSILIKKRSGTSKAYALALESELAGCWTFSIQFYCAMSFQKRDLKNLKSKNQMNLIVSFSAFNT